MGFSNDFSEALAELEDVLPQTFTWPIEALEGTAAYPCFAKGPTKAATLESGGFAVTNTVTIVARRELFSNGTPQRGEQISHRGVGYRISEVLQAQGDTFIRITAVESSKGA